MKNVFFFEIKQIPDNSNLFDEFKQQNIFFSYLQIQLYKKEGFTL